MTTIRVNFDGNVFVPEGPVDLPVGTKFEIVIPSESTPEAKNAMAKLLKLAESASENPDWPQDGAAQVDHYLYGTPKRP